MKYQLFRRSWHVDETEETWALRVEQGSAVLDGPRGQQVVLRHYEDPRYMLEEIQLQAPDALEVRSAHTTQIMASEKLREWLPLFLNATGPSTSPEESNASGRPDRDWGEFDDYFQDLLDLDLDPASGLMVHVDGQPWAVVDGVAGQLVIPTEYCSEGGLLTTWANWLWIEQGSMTGGWDFAWIGTLTRTVGASHDQMDEAGSQWRLFPLDDPTREIVEWLTHGWLISQLRDTWDTFSGDDPLIQGFIDMLTSGGSDLQFFGADYAKGDVGSVGLTDTAQWIIRCAMGAQPRESLLRALKALPKTTPQHLS